MTYEIKSLECICALKVFKINGIKADYKDFGEKYDHDPDHAPEYGCGYMEFEAKDSTPEVLDKYHITEEDYEEICDKLHDELTFGNCGWCV